jgi:hypothetical protein
MEMQINFQVILTDDRVAWDELREVKNFEEFKEYFLQFDQFAKDQTALGRNFAAYPRATLIHPNTNKTREVFDEWVREVTSELFFDALDNYERQEE